MQIAKNGPGTSAYGRVWSFVVSRARPLGIGLVLVLLNRLCSLAQPYLVKYVVDDVIVRNNVNLLWTIGTATIIMTAVQAITARALNPLVSRTGLQMIASLRAAIQDHVCRLPLSFYDQNTHGALTSRIINDVEGLETLAGDGLIQFLGSLIAVVVSAAVLVHLSFWPGLLVLSLMFAFIVYYILWLKGARVWFRTQRERLASVLSRLVESLGGIRVIKSYRAESREAAIFAGHSDKLLEADQHVSKARATMSSVTAGFVGGTSLIVVVLCAVQVHARQMTLGDFMTFSLFVGVLGQPLVELVMVGTQFTRALAGIERVDAIFSTKPEQPDPARVISRVRFQGDVVFEDVCFEYVPGVPVLTDISFHTPPGSVTALVGPSGSGKTTIANLLAALYTPQRGIIRVDGLDLSTVQLDSYRSHLALVSQDAFLFDGTIWDNVVYSRPEASHQDVLRAFNLSHVASFASALPDGYSSRVGERGVLLSAGQRQRISIARALLADPALLILDEATSNLDAESECLIQQSLANLIRNRTTLIIAHRLSSIRSASQILFVEDGRIVERGQPHELLALGGRFAQLHNWHYGTTGAALSAR